jgi:hypothetical protein
MLVVHNLVLNGRPRRRLSMPLEVAADAFQWKSEQLGTRCVALNGRHGSSAMSKTRMVAYM